MGLPPIVIPGGPLATVWRWLVILAWIVLGGGLVVAVFVVSFLVAMQSEMRSSQVSVPDLEGLTLDEALRQVEPLELVLEVAEERHDPRTSSGRVIEQTPPADVSVRRGRKVKLVLSLGGRVLDVPDLVGQAARAVTIELGQLGFSPGDEVHVYSDAVPEGRVIAQVPPASSTAVPSSRVSRLVSSGPRTPVWVMPDLSGLTREQAERWVEFSGFRNGPVRKLALTGQAKGTVVAQRPLAGYPVRSRDVVELTVSQ